MPLRLSPWSRHWILGFTGNYGWTPKLTPVVWIQSKQKNGGDETPVAETVPILATLQGRNDDFEVSGKGLMKDVI